MRYWIVGIGLSAWGGIVGLSWWLAAARIAICQRAGTYTAEANCMVRATAARDNVLTIGLTVALVVAVVTALVWIRRTTSTYGIGRPVVKSAVRLIARSLDREQV